MAVDLLKVESEVTKETHELAVLVGATFRASWKALKDGLQAEDMATMLAPALRHAQAALQDSSKMPEEFKARPGAATNALTLEITKSIDEALKEDAPEA